MLRSRQLWMLCWQFFALNYGWYFNVTWLPTYLREARHLAIASTALLSMLPLFMGGLGNPVSVFLTARLTRKLNDVGRARRMVARLGFVGAGGFLFFSTRMPGPLAAMLAIGMASFCNDFVMPVAWSSAADIGGEHAGTLSGAMNMWGNLGGALSPIAIGYMLDATHNNWNLTFYVSAAVYLTGAVFWSFLDPVTPLGRETGR
jgi:ACS family glucarate transporter-like MFS transporter